VLRSDLPQELEIAGFGRYKPALPGTGSRITPAMSRSVSLEGVLDGWLVIEGQHKRMLDKRSRHTGAVRMPESQRSRNLL
jgi:hypothetical protein